MHYNWHCKMCYAIVNSIEKQMCHDTINWSWKCCYNYCFFLHNIYYIFGIIKNKLISLNGFKWGWQEPFSSNTCILFFRILGWLENVGLFYVVLERWLKIHFKLCYNMKTTLKSMLLNLNNYLLITACSSDDDQS